MDTDTATIHLAMATDTHFTDMDTVSDIMATPIMVTVTVDSVTMVAITNRKDDIMDTTIRKEEAF